MRQCVKDIEKYSFPQRMVEKWNVLMMKLLQHIMCIALKKN
ncbi:hypothetical protein E2C01_088152 [Portunus trituberculatus]|uniref:Uncharacterized protein n=1 Tax=Portunus trituberculatus TaxID=210409 RepID=A0A5B7JIG3_PORTR|nr:hypothetical protein [Portunus trituberculatus]